MAGRDKRVDVAAYAVPLAKERRHHHRIDDRLDVVAAGVVGAELGSAGRVEGALEERPEDRGVDRAPVEAGHQVDAVEILAGEGHDFRVGEEVAVEVAHRLDAELAPVSHRLEEARDEATEHRRVAVRLGDEPREQVIRQQPHVFGEEAEDHAIEKACHLLGVDPSLTKRRRDPRDAFRRVLGDPLRRLLRLQPIRIEEHRPEHRQVAFIDEVVDRELDAPRRGVGEVRPHDEPLHVRHDQRGGLSSASLYCSNCWYAVVRLAARPLYSQAKWPRFQTSAQPPPPPALPAPFSKQNAVPAGSAAAGGSWPTSAQRSRKCCWEAERSVRSTRRHLGMNSVTVIRAEL